MRVIILYLLLKFCNSFKPMVKKLAVYSKYSYEIKRGKTDYDDIQVFNDENSKDTIISCRGSSSWRDWKYNINLFPMKHPLYKGRVHRGYLNYFTHFIHSKKFYELSDMITEKEGNVLLTGHSSGAVKSLLLGHHLSEIYKDKHFVVVTFGTPKIANSIYFNNLRLQKNLEYTSILLTDDIVTKLGIGIQDSKLLIKIQPNIVCKNWIIAHNMNRYVEAILNETFGTKYIYRKSPEHKK